jgi:DNA-binding GntR family transcriptional regulator
MSAIPIRRRFVPWPARGSSSCVPNRRAVVSPISVRELEDIFRVREQYEAELAALSAPL